MRCALRALVVANCLEWGQSLATWLGTIGLEATVMTDFSSARSALDAQPPLILITEVKLAAFNGLHLVSRLRRARPHTPAIVIGDADVVLEADARQFGAKYLRRPLNQEDLTATAKALIDEAPAVEHALQSIGLPDAETLRVLALPRRSTANLSSEREFGTLVMFRPAWRTSSN